MKRLSLLAFIFSILSLFFIILLILFRQKFALYPLMSNQDAVDLFTPLVLIPVYWLLFKSSAKDVTSLVDEILFFIFAVIWVEGHGIHLSANSIHNLIDALAKNPAIMIAMEAMNKKI